MENFIIPKKYSSIFQTAENNSSIDQLLTANYSSNKQPYLGIKTLKTVIIHNKKTEERYNEKKAQLKKTGRIIQEINGFLFIPTTKVDQIAQEGGLEIGNIKKSILGQQDKGIHLFRYSDICLLDSKMYSNKYYHDFYGHRLWNPNLKREKFDVPIERDEMISCLMIFKILIGNVLTVMVNNSENNIDPSPMHNIHLPDKKPMPEDKSFILKRNKSLLYTYEYDMDTLTPSARPRNILPYAIIYYSKQPKLNIEYMLKKPDSYNRKIQSKNSIKVHKTPSQPENVIPDSTSICDIKTIDKSMSTNPFQSNQCSIANTNPTFESQTYDNHVNGFNNNAMLSQYLSNNCGLRPPIPVHLLPDFKDQNESKTLINLTGHNEIAGQIRYSMTSQSPLQIKKETEESKIRISTITLACNKLMSDLGLEKGFDFNNFIFSIMLKVLSMFTDKYTGLQEDKMAVNKTMDLLMEYISAFNSKQDSQYKENMHQEIELIIEDLVANLQAEQPIVEIKNENLEGNNLIVKTEFDSHDLSNNNNQSTQNDMSFNESSNLLQSIKGAVSHNKRKLAELDSFTQNSSSISQVKENNINSFVFDKIKNNDPRYKKEKSENLKELELQSQPTIMPINVSSIDNKLNNLEDMEFLSPILSDENDLDDAAKTDNIKLNKNLITEFHGHIVDVLPVIIPLGYNKYLIDPRKVLQYPSSKNKTSIRLMLPKFL